MTDEQRDTTSSISGYERRARSWDRWITVVILIGLLVPFPYVRLELWPRGTVVTERLITPWSKFRLCHVSFPEGEISENICRFTWKGEILSRDVDPMGLFLINPAEEPLLKWQNSREIRLKELFLRGNYLRVTTFWRPVLFWPFSMLWQTFSAYRPGAQGGAERWNST